MYLRWLRLTNIKLIAELGLSLEWDGQPRMWTVVVGENGTCKTTLLQAIALATAGSDLIPFLLRSGRQDLGVSLGHAQRPDAGSEIAAEFSFGALGDEGIDLPHGQYFRRLYPEPKTGALTGGLPGPPPSLEVRRERVAGQRSIQVWDQYRGMNEAASTSVLSVVQGAIKPTPGWMVLGYGVDRNLPRPEQLRTHSPLEGRYVSLFGAGQLTATEFHRRFRDRGRDDLADHFSQVLQRVIDEAVDLVPGLMSVHWGLGPGGPPSVTERQTARLRLGGVELSVPLTWMSQGYQSTLGWIADMIGQFIEDVDAAIGPEQMEGLVLIDELDLHLHPTWQVGIVEALRQVFPRIQFIATTHSPLVTSALRADEVLLLRMEEGRVVAAQPTVDPRRLTGSELYAALYGIEATFPSRVGQQAWRYARLSQNPFRSAAEEAEREGLALTLVSAGALPAVAVRPREET
jgi:hypothetical protein